MEWPNAGWMDGCPCEDAFYAGTHIASCELTSSPAAAASGRGGSNPAPMPTRSGTGPSPSTTADSEAGIFMLVYASFAVASFLALVIVSWWWKREGQRRRRDEAIAAELANPWNVMARMRAWAAYTPSIPTNPLHASSIKILSKQGVRSAQRNDTSCPHAIRRETELG